MPVVSGSNLGLDQGTPQESQTPLRSAKVPSGDAVSGIDHAPGVFLSPRGISARRTVRRMLWLAAGLRPGRRSGASGDAFSHHGAGGR